MSVTTPRKWANEIKAWADGAEIEYSDPIDQSGIWFPASRPTWRDDVWYRIKCKWQKELDAWVLGKPIEFRLSDSNWINFPKYEVGHKSFFYEGYEFRIKSEPVKEVSKKQVAFHPGLGAYCVAGLQPLPNVEFIFHDGVLVDVKLIKETK